MKRKEPTHSEDLNIGVPCSSTSPHVGDYEDGTKKAKGNDYEVFLSFRGKETRQGFTDYLYTSLVDARIHVFRDDNELRVGEEIGPELICCITQSIISIPIISEDYASSKWCLHELAQMLKCRRSREQVVLPIFYKVEPSQVRHLTGRFRDAIDAHKKNSDQMVVKKWEDALKEVGCLKGWESEKIDNGHEGSLVRLVVTRVISELRRHFGPSVPTQLVGTDDRVKEIMSKIDFKFNRTLIIGIYGMGGIGKTTLAKVLYNKLSRYFEERSFVANIRETSKQAGIHWLQNKLISDIIGSSHKVSNVDDGIHVLKSRCTSKKVLALLDDMDDILHLNVLIGDGSWFKAGSIVIITTRDKSILDMARAGYLYELNELPLDQSLILFSRHAFLKDLPPSDYEDISCDIVSTAGGLPLALEVIGSFLFRKTMDVWKVTSKKLEKIPDKRVVEQLRISYEALDYVEQQIFLDIACFFIGSSKQSPIYMWDACDFYPDIVVEVLSLKSLIKIDEDGTLMMHDQLRDLGRNIVLQENPKKPQKRSRLWTHEEAKDVLESNKGTSKIEALHLDYYGGKSYGMLGKIGALNVGSHGRKSYRGEQFNKLTNLRFLHVCGVNFTGDFQNLLPQLRWLQWENCPSDFEVANFHLKNLVVLDLLYSSISEYWGGWGPLKVASKLKVLNLSYSRNLRRTPDLSAFKSLEILNLENCWNLEEIHPSTWYIKNLVSLNVHNCDSLKELLARSGRMEESGELLINDTTVEEIMISLAQLDLSETKIEELPEFIGSMKALKTLNANRCVSLARIPYSIGNLASLSLLDLTGCYSLTEMSDSIGKLTSLTKLQLAETSITKLPESIVNLQNLRILNINVTLVTKLPSAIGMLVKLEVLSASWCPNLEGLPSNIGELVSLSELRLDGSGIWGLPECISKLSSLQHLGVRFCGNLREIPEPPSSLTALHITFPTPLLPYLPKLALLKELSLRYCCQLECLPKLPVQLSKLSILDYWPSTSWFDLEKRLSEFILDKSFGLRKATRRRDSGGFLVVDID